MLNQDPARRHFARLLLVLALVPAALPVVDADKATAQTNHMPVEAPSTPPNSGQISSLAYVTGATYQQNDDVSVTSGSLICSYRSLAWNNSDTPSMTDTKWQLTGCGPFTLTTNNSSGPATYLNGVLNIPQYTAAAGPGGAGSTTDVYISATGCPQGADLNTGNAYGTATAANDAGPCISQYLNAHVSPGNLLILHQDGASVVSGIFGPAGGGWGIVSDVKPGITRVIVNSCTISSNVLTCQTPANNGLVAGQGLLLNGFPTSTYLNYSTGNPAILLTSATSTSFTAAYTHANASIEAGVAQQLHGNGFYQKAGANNDVIHNGVSSANCVNGYSDPGYTTPGPAPARGSGLVFRGLMINGNRGNGSNGNSTSGNPTGTGGFNNPYTSQYCDLMGINIMNMQNVVFDDNYLFNTSSYNVRFMNVGNVEADRNSFDEFGPGVQPYESNTDGLHVSAPAEDIHADGNFFRTGDDAWALNAPEGWVGAIERVTITNSRYAGSLSAGRIYTDSIAPPSGDAAPTVRHVVVDGATGFVTGYLGNIGYTNAHTNTVPDSLSDIRFSNYNLTTTTQLYQQSGFTFADGAVDVTFSNMSIAGLRDKPFIEFFNNPGISSLTLNNITSIRTASGNSTLPLIRDSGSATIAKLTINGVTIADQDNAGYGSLPALVQGNSNTMIVNFCANAVDTSNVSALITGVTPQALCPAGSASGSTSGATITATSGTVNPKFVLNNTAGTTDVKTFDFLLEASGTLHGRAVNDANTAANDWVTVTRSGDTITGINFPVAPTVAGQPASSGSGVRFLGGSLSTSNFTLGAGAGTGASISAVYGTDSNHVVVVYMGSNPTANQPIYTLNFAQSRGSAYSFCSTMPANAPAAAQALGTATYGTGTNTNQFVLYNASVAAGAQLAINEVCP